LGQRQEPAWHHWRDKRDFVHRNLLEVKTHVLAARLRPALPPDQSESLATTVATIAPEAGCSILNLEQSSMT
jgi:hypothetical protein